MTGSGRRLTCEPCEPDLRRKVYLTSRPAMQNAAPLTKQRDKPKNKEQTLRASIWITPVGEEKRAKEKIKKITQLRSLGFHDVRRECVGMKVSSARPNFASDISV